MKLFFTFILSLSLYTISFAQGEVLIHVDEMPYFSGCNDFGTNIKAKRKCSNSNLVHFISLNLEYPEEAKEQGINGTVLISFVVDEYGVIQDPYVLKDIGGGCGDAALDVVNKMGRWEAGVNKNKKVKVKLNLPIKFSLSSDSDPGAYSINWGNIKGKAVNKKTLKANVEESIIVRDAFGNSVVATELIVAYERKRKFIDAISKGHLNASQRKIIKKVKKGGILTISATVQEGSEFREIDKEFEIIK